MGRLIGVQRQKNKAGTHSGGKEQRRTKKLGKEGRKHSASCYREKGNHTPRLGSKKKRHRKKRNYGKIARGCLPWGAQSGREAEKDHRFNTNVRRFLKKS